MNKKSLKYYFLILSIIYSFGISQEISSAEYVATGSFGAATINGKIYNQISFRPEIRYKKLGVTTLPKIA